MAGTGQNFREQEPGAKTGYWIGAWESSMILELWLKPETVNSTRVIMPRWL